MSEEAENGKDNGNERNHGPQPLDKIMTDMDMNSHALVAASAQPMTHKAVVRARKGRQLTPKMKVRMTEALNVFMRLKGEETRYGVRDLFNY